MYPQVQNPQGSVVATMIAMLLVYTVHGQRHKTWGRIIFVPQSGRELETVDWRKIGLW